VNFFQPWPPQPEEKRNIPVDFVVLEIGDDTQIDTGVTSGADPSEWDPIEVDEGRVDSCDANGAGAGKDAPAICHTEKK
jgi:hypothetical protein